MKRSSKLFFAGTLCFSLGYIAHDLVGEAKDMLVGSALASSLTPRIEPTLAPYRNSSRPPRLLLAGHASIQSCDMLREMRSSGVDDDDRGIWGFIMTNEGIHLPPDLLASLKEQVPRECPSIDELRESLQRDGLDLPFYLERELQALLPPHDYPPLEDLVQRLSQHLCHN